MLASAAMPALLALLLLGAMHETAAQQCSCANVFESLCSPSGCSCPGGLPYTESFIGCGPTPGSAWTLSSCNSTDGRDSIGAVAFSPDGSYVALGSAMGMMELKHTGTSDCVATAMTDTDIFSLAITSDGKKIITGVDTYNKSARTIRVWHNGTTTTLSGHKEYVNAVAVVPGDKKLVSGGSVADMTVRVWNLTSNKPIKTMKGHSDAISDIAVSPDGARVASCSFDRTIRIWSLTTYKVLTILKAEYSDLRIAYTPDGKRLVVGTYSTVDVWDLSTKKLINSKSTGTRVRVNSIKVSTNGKFAVSGSADGSIQFWNLANLTEAFKYVVQGTPVMSVAISPNNRVAVAGAGNLLVRFSVDPNTGIGKWISSSPL